MQIEPGMTVVFHYRDRDDNTMTYYIRAIVDGMIAFRHWNAQVNDWHYSIEHPSYFEARAEYIEVLPAGQVTRCV